MLATTAVEFAPLELPLAVVATDMQPITPATAPAVWVTRLNEEGGFITSQYSWDAATNGGAAAMFGDTISSDTLNDLIEYRGIGAGNTLSTTRGWVLVNELAAFSGRIEPVVVVVADSNADVSSALIPILSKIETSPTDSDEGGSIPIERILANSELERGSEVGRPVRLVSLADENQGDSAATANLAAARAANAGITGEWARAMVFELAGGEPERDGRLLLDDRNDRSSSTKVDLKLQDDRPLSSTRTHGAAGQLQIPDATIQTVSATMPATRAGAWVDTLLGELNSLIGDGHSADESDSAPLAANSHSASDVGSGAGQGAGAASLTGSVIETAFEQIGSSTQSVLQSLAGESWHRTFGAAPLLMVLALERIAAGNSRRANRDVASIAVRRPKFNHLADDSERT